VCLILTAYKVHPEYPLIILANRDEFYARPTQNAHWWKNEDNILAGKDLKAGGTWLGVNRQKNFCALTNYRDPSGFRPDARSRGDLVSNYLKEEHSVCHYGTKYLYNVEEYNDFNLMFYEQETAYYFSSLEQVITELDPGFHGLSNDSLNSPWPKVEKGIERIKEFVTNGAIDVEAAFHVLSDKNMALDDELPETGVGLDTERLLSPMHIDFPGYGTRSSTVVLFKKDGGVEFYETDHLTGEKLAFSF